MPRNDTAIVRSGGSSGGMATITGTSEEVEKGREEIFREYPPEGYGTFVKSDLMVDGVRTMLVRWFSAD